MNKSLFLTGILIGCLIFSTHSTAQIGWQWGSGSVIYGNMYTEGTSVTTDKNGNIFCGGFVDIYGTTSEDSSKFGPFTMSTQNEGLNQMFVTKMDASGHYQWLLCARGSGSSLAASMAADSLGNLYVLATFFDTCILGADTLSDLASRHYALVKVSSSGSVLWAKKLGSQGPVPYNYEESIGTDGAGNIYVAGVFSGSYIAIGTDTVHNLSTTGYRNVFVAKFDPSGNVLWTNGLESSQSVPYGGMAVSKNGSVYVDGVFSWTLTSGSHTLNAAPGQTQPFVVKMDSSGHIVWMNTCTQSLLSYTAIATDNYDRIYITGYFQGAITYGSATFTPPYPSGYHVLTACLDTSSAVIWARAAYDTDALQIYPVAINVDGCGKVVVAGSMAYGLTSPPGTDYLLFGTDTLHVPANAIDPVFVAEYDSSGNYLHSDAIASGGEDYFNAHIDYMGNVYVCSDNEMPKLVVAADTLLASTGECFFVAKYHYDNALCAAEIKAGVETIAGDVQAISLYPNPTSGTFTVSRTVPFTTGASAELLDMTGRRLRVCGLYGSSTAVPVAGLAPGIYLCRILPGDGSAVVRKVVVE